MLLLFCLIDCHRDISFLLNIIALLVVKVYVINASRNLQVRAIAYSYLRISALRFEFNIASSSILFTYFLSDYLLLSEANLASRRMLQHILVISVHYVGTVKYSSCASKCRRESL